MGKRIERHQFSGIVKIIQKDFSTHKKCTTAESFFFKIKQEDNEVLHEYWKRLADIEKKCETNRITPEDTITHKFAANINDKKAQEQSYQGLIRAAIDA